MKDVLGKEIKIGDTVLACFTANYETRLRKAKVINVTDHVVFIRRKKKDGKEIEYGCDERECKRRIVVIESKEE